VKIIGKADRGRFLPDDPGAWAICLRHHEGKRVTVEMDVLRGTRSDAANRRYFGTILPMVRAFIDEERAANDQPPMDWGPGDEWKERLHASLVARHAGVEETVIGPIRKSTRVMTTREFFDYTESVTRWLAEHGWYVPEQAEAVGA
jgi:hypothetical protein